MTVVHQDVKFVVRTDAKLYWPPDKLDLKIISVLFFGLLPVATFFKDFSYQSTVITWEHFKSIHL
jgi:hypothetical protein